MIIWGKIVGAILGLIMYGPVGLILGLVFGQVFDNGLRTLLRTPVHATNVRQVFFKTVFQTLGYLAKADGIVSEREVQITRNIMLHDFQLDKQQMLLAIGFFNEGKSTNFSIGNALNNFKNVCGNYVDLRRFFLEIIVKVALADKILRDSQRDRLLFICSALNIPLGELEYQLRVYGFGNNANYYQKTSTNQRTYANQRTNNQYKNQQYTQNTSSDALSAAYTLLGVKSSDNVKIIKASYRKLMSKYHPDKLMSKGVPPAMLDFAKEKTQQISSAYALIMRHREE